MKEERKESLSKYIIAKFEDLNQDVSQIEKHILENEERIQNNNLLLNLLQQESLDHLLFSFAKLRGHHRC